MSRGKVGIITLYGNYNFGNRLQNYAVQQIFRNRGFDVETLVCEKSRSKYYARNVRRSLKFLKGNGVGRRHVQFKKFNRRKIPTRYFFTKDGLFPSSIAGEYSFFSVGSDQVWNPELRKNERDNFFLRFARRDQRICVSPSIGVAEIEKKYWADYYDGLQGFPYLSCRESEGALAISGLTGRSCAHLIDPTLAITGEEWRERFAEPVKEKDPYVVVFFLGEADADLTDNVKKFASGKGYKIIWPSDPKDKYYGISPEQFVYMIDHAALVFTDSFHVAAFSVNLKTPFYVYDRHERLDASNKMNSRIRSLTSLFGLEDRYVDRTFNLFSEECGFEKADATLEKEREAFDLYIDECTRQGELAPNALPDSKCTGCLACVSACPVKCLEGKKDREGFVRPVLDQARCVNCGRCAAVCPVISLNRKNGEHTEAYAAYQNDVAALEKSSSGAVFPLICKWVIEKEGVVFGAVIDDHQTVRHAAAQTLKGCEAFYSSKYVQSDTGSCYEQALSYLKDGRYVLFSGTPCQAEGLRAFLGKEYEKLILVDFVCHGVPSPDVWSDHVNMIKDVYLSGEDITAVNFRDKTSGWENYSLTVKSENHTYIGSRTDDPYCKGFSANLFLRRSCHDCAFKGTERDSDITLGDFWGADGFLPEAKNAGGTSMVLVHSAQGRMIWNDISVHLTSTSFDVSKYAERSNRAMMISVAPNENRKAFFSDRMTMGTGEAVAKNAVVKKRTFAERAIGKIRRTLRIRTGEKR